MTAVVVVVPHQSAAKRRRCNQEVAGWELCANLTVVRGKILVRGARTGRLRGAVAALR